MGRDGSDDEEEVDDDDDDDSDDGSSEEGGSEEDANSAPVEEDTLDIAEALGFELGTCPVGSP